MANDRLPKQILFIKFLVVDSVVSAARSGLSCCKLT